MYARLIAGMGIASLLLACGEPGRIGEGTSDDQGDILDYEPSPGAGAPTEQCGNQLDDDGDGSVDEGCPCPELGAEQACYTGPAETRGTAPCEDGVQRCVGDEEFLTWGPCEGAQPPTVDICDDGVDQDCNGTVDDGPGCWGGDQGGGGDVVDNPGAGNDPVDWDLPTNDPPCDPEDPSCWNGDDGNGDDGDDYTIGGPDDGNGDDGGNTGGDGGDDYTIGGPDDGGTGGGSGNPGGDDGDDYTIGGPNDATDDPSSSNDQPNSETYDVILYGASFRDRACRVGPLDLPIFEGDCDVFAKVSMAGQRRKTKTKGGDSSPTWNQLLFRFDADTILNNSIYITFKDSDLFGNDDLRDCVRQFTQQHLDEGKAVFTNCGKSNSVTFLLRN